MSFLSFLESSIESKSLYFNSDFHGFVSLIYFLLKMNRTKSHRPKNKARKPQIPLRLPQLQSCFRKKSKNWLNKQNFRMRKKEKPFCICKSNKRRVGLLMKYNFRSKVDSSKTLPRGSKVWTKFSFLNSYSFFVICFSSCSFQILLDLFISCLIFIGQSLHFFDFVNPFRFSFECCWMTVLKIK